MDIKDVIYSEELNLILKQSEDWSKSQNLAEVSLENVQAHILVLYLSGDKNLAGKNLSRLIWKKVSKEEKDEFLEKIIEARNRAEKFLEKRTYSGDDMPEFSEPLRRVIERVSITLDVIETATAMESKKAIDTETFFTAMFFEQTDINTLLRKHGIDNTALLIELTNTMAEMENEEMLREEVEENVEEDMPEDKKDKEESDFEAAGEKSAIHVRKPKKNSSTPTLDEFGVDMTEKASNGDYDPLVGRDKEVSQIIEILCCRKKCNAILIGPAGSGKTALVEGLSQRIVSGNVPRELKGKRIVSISTTDLTAGTQYRGQLEERVQNLCEELKNDKRTILMIDEFQSAVGSDGNTSSIGNMLKPSLSRGEITVIAATTQEEYFKYVAKDSAIKRRFQTVYVSEPDKEETFKILKGLVKKYSEFHKVRYTDEVLRVCVDYSERYMMDRRSPDRAIDLLDTAGALAKLSSPSDTKELDRLEKEKAEATKKKVKAIDKSDFSLAKEQRDEEDRLTSEIEALKKKLASTDPKTWPEVTLYNVAEVISKISGVEVTKIVTPDMAKIKGMREVLSKNLIGQDEAIDEVVKALSKSFLGLRDENRPIASLFFAGNTATGKTRLAELVAETIYGKKDALVRLEMGEYSQSGSITKLLGASASFVGFNQGAFFDQFKTKTSGVFLVDEVEKASDEILQSIFLNILDRGIVRLADNTEVSFRNFIIIFTSNVGCQDLELKANGIGFGDRTAAERKATNKETVMKAMAKKFRPEFRSRLSKTVVFNDLSESDLGKIFDLELAKFKDRIKQRGYALKVTKALKEKVVKEADPKSGGARNLKRKIGEFIEDILVADLVEGNDAGRKKITMDFVDDKVIVNYA